jgi:hypothetical protein
MDSFNIGRRIAVALSLAALALSCGSGSDVPTSPSSAPPPAPVAPPPPSPPVPPSGRFGLDGYVYDVNTRVPLRASVELRTPEGVSVVKATTDGGGHYIFIGGVDAGTYVFVIAAAGYDELTATLSHSGNLTRDFAVTPTGVVSVFFGLGTVTPGCVSNRPGPTNVRVSNRTIYTMRVTVYGCQLIERCEPDPVSRTVTLVPDGTQTSIWLAVSTTPRARPLTAGPRS